MIIRTTLACLAALLALVGCAHNDVRENPMHDIVWGPWFKLQVAPSFNSPVEYRVNRHSPHYLIYTQYSGRGGYDWGSAEEVSRIPLTEDEHGAVKKLLEEALVKHPLTDDFMGPDGTTWVLESQLYHYAKFSIWEPEYDTELRGYSSLVALKDYLDTFISREAN